MTTQLFVAENTAAGMLRGLNVPPKSWGELVAIAQSAMSEYEHRNFLERSKSLYTESAAYQLICAARILEAAAWANEKGTKDQKVIDRLLLLSASAYAMYGNFPSAHAVQKEIIDEHLDSDALHVAAAITDPRRIEKTLSLRDLSYEARLFLERLLTFLVGGESAKSKSLISDLEKIMVETKRPADVVCLRAARLALRHLIELSVASNLKAYDGELFRRFSENLIEDRRYCLLPPQYSVLHKSDLVKHGTSNALVNLPTSTGKTLLAELATVAALEEAPGIAVYVVPYIALGNQVYDTFKRHMPQNITVRPLFGGYKESGTLTKGRRSQVIVATPERFDAIMRASGPGTDLRLVIVDEAHHIESGSRGVRLEGLISRLRMLQLAGEEFSIILMSAVLNDTSALQKWLGIKKGPISDGWRPTARRIALWEHDGNLTWLYGNDPIRPSHRSGTDSLGKRSLPWPKPMYATDVYQMMEKQKPLAFENVSYLAKFVRSEIGGPVLIVCGTKPNTRALAAALADSLEPDDLQSEARDEIERLILAEAPYLKPLISMVRRGVAFHNASVPAKIRRSIEGALKENALNYVVATTTLAEGVDLPFRVTIIYDWLLGFKEAQKPMASLLFRNIAGRCGRAGEFSEGDTIIFENVLGNLQFTHQTTRKRAISTLFSDPPPLESRIGNDTNTTEEREQVEAMMSSQFMAAVAEHADEDHLDKLFQKSTYAHAVGNDTGTIFERVRKDLLANDNGEPFAIAASPIKLTDLGRAANFTGLSLKTSRELLSFLRKQQTNTEIPALCEALLLTVGDCPEQQNYTLRDVVVGKKNSKFFVKAGDIQSLVSNWLKHIPLQDMFCQLPKASSSRAAVHPVAWVNGEGQSDSVARQFDKFVDFAEYTFAGFLPWMLRSCEPLSPFGADWSKEIKWKEIAEKLESSASADEEAADAGLVSEQE